MSKPYLKALAFMLLIGLGLTACGNRNSNGGNNTLTYVHSTDTHPCLGVAVMTPDALEIGIETTVRVNVNNGCDRAVLFTSTATPYTLLVIKGDDEIVQVIPEARVTLPDEFSVPADGTTFYDVPVLLPADDVLPGTYRIIANLYVDRDTGPDATQYVEPLRLESEPQNVEVKP